jgi:hypoxanthine phosphoribosyltransferase
MQRLPKLLVLEVKRCEHPDVLVAPARGGAHGLASGLSDYQEVQELYRELRPKLRFEVLK